MSGMSAPEGLLLRGHKFFLSAVVFLFVLLHFSPRALQELENPDARIAALESNLKYLVYENVCRSLFKVRDSDWPLTFLLLSFLCEVAAVCDCSKR